MWKDVEKDILFSHGLNSFIFFLRASSSRGFYLKCVSRSKRLFFYVFIGRWFSE
nr:MAG TPA: hypothetical protein [Caudoviricetes sp.]